MNTPLWRSSTNGTHSQGISHAKIHTACAELFITQLTLNDLSNASFLSCTRNSAISFSFLEQQQKLIIAFGRL